MSPGWTGGRRGGGSTATSAAAAAGPWPCWPTTRCTTPTRGCGCWWTSWGGSGSPSRSRGPPAPPAVGLPCSAGKQYTTTALAASGRGRPPADPHRRPGPRAPGRRSSTARPSRWRSTVTDNNDDELKARIARAVHGSVSDYAGTDGSNLCVYYALVGFAVASAALGRGYRPVIGSLV